MGLLTMHDPSQLIDNPFLVGMNFLTPLSSLSSLLQTVVGVPTAVVSDAV